VRILARKSMPAHANWVFSMSIGISIFVGFITKQMLVKPVTFRTEHDPL